MIYAVANEGRSDVFPTFAKLGIPYDVRELKFCDYAVGDFDGERLIGVPIERKSADDFIKSKSAGSGNLDSHLYELSTNSPISYICIIGDLFRASLDNNVSWNAILSSLAGSSYRRSPDGCQGVVQLLQFTLTEDFCKFLKYLDEKVQRNEPRLPIFPKKAKSKPEEVLPRIIAGWPKVGEKTSLALIEKFNSVRDFVNATPEQLMQVDGVGKKLAFEIWNACNMKYRLVME